jgi:hypothetical protein
MRGRFAVLLDSSWLGCVCPQLLLDLIWVLLPMPLSFQAWPATLASLVAFSKACSLLSSSSSLSSGSS